MAAFCLVVPSAGLLFVWLKAEVNFIVTFSVHSINSHHPLLDWFVWQFGRIQKMYCQWITGFRHNKFATSCSNIAVTFWRMSLFVVRFKNSIKYYLRQVVKAYMTIWTKASQNWLSDLQKMEISIYSCLPGQVNYEHYQGALVNAIGSTSHEQSIVQYINISLQWPNLKVDWLRVVQISAQMSKYIERLEAK